MHEAFESAAQDAARTKIEELKKLTMKDVLLLPEASAEDIVVAGKEVQRAIFRQMGVPDLPDAVLVTVQVSRAALGGIVKYLHENGLVFLPDGSCRQATEAELLATGG